MAPFVRWGWRSREDGFWLPLPTTVRPSPLSFQPCGVPVVTSVSRALTGLGLGYWLIREVGWRKESKATHLVPCSLSAGSSQICGPCTKGHGSVGTTSLSKGLRALCHVPCTLFVKFSPHYPDLGWDRSLLCAKILSEIMRLAQGPGRA